MRGSIAFARFVADEYDLKPDGTDMRRLTNARGKDAHAAWSPDGGRLAFASARGSVKDERAQVGSIALAAKPHVFVGEREIALGIEVLRISGRITMGDLQRCERDGSA
jgi:hypothetical protein